MSYDCYIGIDYGTSTCKLAYVIPPYRKLQPSPEPFSFATKGTNSSARFPSSIAFPAKKSKPSVEIGFEAANTIADVSNRKNGDTQFVLSPKMDLGKGIIYPFAPLKYSEPADLCSLTIGEMMDEFERTMNMKRKKCKILVSVPASFGFDQRTEILGAISEAGIESGTDLLIDEPNAAFIGFLHNSQFSTLLRRTNGGRVLLIDFGAGTCDLSVLDVERDPTNEPYGVSISNLAISDYAEVGGNDIDRAISRTISDYLINASKGSRVQDIEPAEAAESITSKISTISRLFKEQSIHDLTRASSSGRNLKLSHVEVPRLHFDWGSLRNQHVPYGERQLYESIDTVMRNLSSGGRVSCEGLVNNALHKAGLKPKDINAILLAGGSSRIFALPQYREFLLSLFPHLNDQHLLTTPDADLLISKGAALEAYYTFDLRKSIIRPICPSNIGVLTAEKRNEILIPAGTPLPYPNQEDKKHDRLLYIPDPKPESLRIPISVSRFGKWTSVETWTVDLPNEIESNEPLVFSARMTLDKILEISFRSKTRPEFEFKTQCTTWMNGRELTPRETRIQLLRTQLKSKSKQGLVTGQQHILALVGEEHEAGYFKLVKERCEFQLNQDGISDSDKARYWNFLGLARAQLGLGRELAAYEHASKLCPDQWVYHFNIGVTHLWSTHRFADAEKELAAATRLSPFVAMALYHYGEALEYNGKLPESRAAFSRALEYVKREFDANPAKPQARKYFRYTCDKLGLPYPANLQPSLFDLDEADPENIQPSLTDHGDIVRSERTAR